MLPLDFIFLRLPDTVQRWLTVGFAVCILVFLAFWARGAVEMAERNWDVFLITMTWFRVAYFYIWELGMIALLAIWRHRGIGPTYLKIGRHVRYRQADQACEVASGDRGSLTVTFDEPQRAVAPGQYVVFYDGERCLGGAVIDQIHKINDAASAIIRAPGHLAGHG